MTDVLLFTGFRRPMVKQAVLIAAGVAVAASLPNWLPRLVVTARGRVFAAVNGDEGIAVPGPRVDASRLRELYEHPAAKGRGPGSRLSDLLWYWMSPGAHVHQEQMESGPLHSELTRCTRGIAAARGQDIDALARRCARRVLDGVDPAPRRTVRLRDMVMPMAAEFFHELVFLEPCPPGARKLITSNTDDVWGALKCSRLRHMDRRAALTAYLLDRIRTGTVGCDLPPSLSDEDSALYLQSNIFSTGVGQLAEAVSHLLLALGHHPHIQRRMAAEPMDIDFYDRAINESLRMFPLFGIAQRITTGPIDIGGETLPTGSVLCLNHLAYQRSGFADPDRFDPDRWLALSPKDATFIPFGVVGNRPCPARGLSIVFMRAVTDEILRRFTLYSSAGHSRSLPNRAPCLLLPRTPAPTRPTAALAVMRLRGNWEDVARSLAQLALGCLIVTDARRQQLCRRHHDHATRDTAPTPGTTSQCPVPEREAGARHD